MSIGRKQQVINFITNKLKDTNIRMLEWFNLMLARTTITLYPTASEGFKKRYMEYITKEGNAGLENFRAYHYPAQIFTYAQPARRDKLVTDVYGIVRKSDVVLNDNYETIESLAWLLLHELGHVYVKAMQQHDILWSGWLESLNKVEMMNTTNRLGVDYVYYWDHYLTSDEIHESRPEEIFCNMIATAIIGKQLCRIWWRNEKNKNHQIGE